MAIKFIGWGKWGRSVTSCLFSRLSAENCQCAPIAEDDSGLGHFPDPVAAEAWFLNSREKLRSTLAAPDSTYRVHFINPAEHFASGTLAGFLKNRSLIDVKKDFLIAYLPPAGANTAAVGRFLAYTLGKRSFPDVFICLDGCAPIFCDEDEWAASNYASALGEFLYAFERAGCLIPLLFAMRSRILGAAFRESHTINSDCSLAPLWRNLTLGLKGMTKIPDTARNILAISVSEQIDHNLDSIISRNLAPDRVTYLPFLRNYEWQNLSMPQTAERGSIQSFLGALCSGLVPREAETALYEYYDAYWPENDESEVETLDPAVEDWVQRHKLKLPDLARQNIKYLKQALNFIKSNS